MTVRPIEKPVLHMMWTDRLAQGQKCIDFILVCVFECDVEQQKSPLPGEQIEGFDLEKRQQIRLQGNTSLRTESAQAGRDLDQCMTHWKSSTQTGLPVSR